MNLNNIGVVMKKIASDKNYKILKESQKRALVDHKQLQEALRKLKKEMKLEMQRMLSIKTP